MIGSVTMYAINACLIDASNPSTHTSATEQIAEKTIRTGPSKQLYCVFSYGERNVPEELRLKHIVSVDLYAMGVVSDIATAQKVGVQIYRNALTITDTAFEYINWNRRGDVLATLEALLESGSSSPKRFKLENISQYDGVGSLNFENGYFAFSLYDIYDGTDDYVYIYKPTVGGVNTGYSPYLVCHYDDVQPKPKVDTTIPSGGFVDRTVDNIFSWRLRTDVDVFLGGFTQTSGFLQWRQGTDGETTSISVGTESNCTIEANTFPAGVVQWRVFLSTDGGDVYSEWITLNTNEVSSTAVVLEPKNVVVDGTKDITFKWEHIISTNTEPTGFDIQISVDGINFTDFVTQTQTNVTRYTVAAGSFGSGPLYWRVRTYNSDNVVGAWSDAAVLTVFASPPTPVLSVVSSSPRAIISWQATDQAAYEYYFSQNPNATYVFGTGRKQKCPYILLDGAQEAFVRIQNKYGLWSDWASATFFVENLSIGNIVLSGKSNGKAILTWFTEHDFDSYILYKNNIPIYKGSSKQFVDNLNKDDDLYLVRGVNGDNYTESNLLALPLNLECNMIADISDFAWLKLRFSDTDLPVVSTVYDKAFSSMNYSGHEYPVVEFSEFKNTTVSLSAAFATKNEAQKLEKLLGKLVCIKTKAGDAVIGVLGTLNKMSNTFYFSYSFTISQVNWNEEIEIDD